MMTRAKRNTPCHEAKRGGRGGGEKMEKTGKRLSTVNIQHIHCDNLVVSMPRYYLWINDKAARSNPACHDKLPQE